MGLPLQVWRRRRTVQGVDTACVLARGHEIQAGYLQCFNSDIFVPTEVTSAVRTSTGSQSTARRIWACIVMQEARLLRNLQTQRQHLHSLVTAQASLCSDRKRKICISISNAATQHALDPASFTESHGLVNVIVGSTKADDGCLSPRSRHATKSLLKSSAKVHGSRILLNLQGNCVMFCLPCKRSCTLGWLSRVTTPHHSQSPERFVLVKDASAQLVRARCRLGRRMLAQQPCFQLKRHAELR